MLFRSEKSNELALATLNMIEFFSHVIVATSSGLVRLMIFRCNLKSKEKIAKYLIVKGFADFPVFLSRGLHFGHIQPLADTCASNPGV